MSEPTPAIPIDDDKPLASRSTAIGTVAFIILALPFLVLGVWLLDGKSRMDLRCGPGGPCTLTKSGWLTREPVATLPLDAIQSVKVERTKSARRKSVPIFRPELMTTQGKLPLFAQWATVEGEATAVKEQVERYLASPGSQSLEVTRDDRRSSLRVGGAFTGVGVGLLVFSLWLAWRTRMHRRVEAARVAG
ncbi:hypothetical protein SAMN05443572_114238 [Myxococcus fulvus]|uniref:Uncharacterized protein n=1 Tax=Myxococcus fulvus TaxID=33 RepID=A0A511TB20_MYXFU|nr:hypothetical protein [Myxococcus fulvus]GEN11389.1 hypothetical protein MFU01_64260 [Myxococcus fulvus]SEU39934.1 hypothetical protein SAMN05443572_114238 [Myxococcus fulvus]